MIRRVTLRYFKRFEEQAFDLADAIVLAGPNNSGKSTLLQALAVWNLAVQRWHTEKGEVVPSSLGLDRSSADSPPEQVESGKSKARPGVRISRKDFTAIPLRELNLLWHERHTAYRKGEGDPAMKAGTHKLIRIDVAGETNGADWFLPFELRYENPELLYAIPVINDPYSIVANVARSVQVVHVPPFSGIGSEETRYDRPYQDLLIGQGKPGDILRNLLLELHQSGSRQDWDQFCEDIRELFGYHLLEPVYAGRPFIVCEYAPGKGDRKAPPSGPRLDVASAGSGFHQVLMLLGFFYARPASVLLLDEPDAHQHVILQKQVFDRLKLVARRRRCQLVIATHSEVLLQNSSVERIISFYRSPHPLEIDTERDQVREALKRLSAMDLLLAEEANGVLYTEGETDLDIMREWARVLGHPALSFLERPLWHNNAGRSPQEARAHHFALRAIRSRVKGILLLDGDNRSLPDHELAADGLKIVRWERYEIENYLIVPDALKRFVSQTGDGLFKEAASKAAARAEEYLGAELPPAVLRDPLGRHDYLNSVAASKTILPGFFKAAETDLLKSDYYQIASMMKPEEIHEEVRRKLDEIAALVGSGE